MTDQRFTLRLADWHRDMGNLRALRKTVFIEEQAVPKAIEWDGLDQDARHAIAEDGEGQAIGTGRLLNTGQIGRMAVLQPWRNQGVGAAILSTLIAEAASTGSYPLLFLNAQRHAEAFYARHGFRPVGEEFFEAGIRHIRMELYND
ncbi:MAG: GNAT family N-acetyltransferase [Sedimenticola sp.]|nr:MAG: GNAT family N-acetyltransferase [Sedimenticola sp.]